MEPNPPSPNHHHFPNSNTTHLSDPPPRPLEEETVKEVVLSEAPVPLPIIPIPKPPGSPSSHEFNKPPIVDPKDSDPDPVNLNHAFPLDVVVAGKTEENSEVFSGISDFTSESVSTTTATTTIFRREKEEDGEEEEVMSQKLEKPVAQGNVSRNRARSGDVAQIRTRTPSKRPVAMAEHRNSPRRGNVGPTGSRRASGVSGGRGLKSPATTGGKRPSSNMVGGSSSMRMRSAGTTGSGRLKSPPMMVEKEQSSGVQVEEASGKQKSSIPASESVSESLENPLVSLECFIFL
ncbi:hypothetical protein Ancab_007869 [Ancistrocladus abbreviatus]